MVQRGAELRVGAGPAQLPRKPVPTFAPRWFRYHCPGLPPALAPAGRFDLGSSAEVMPN